MNKNNHLRFIFWIMLVAVIVSPIFSVSAITWVTGSGTSTSGTASSSTYVAPTTSSTSYSGTSYANSGTSYSTNYSTSSTSSGTSYCSNQCSPQGKVETSGNYQRTCGFYGSSYCLSWSSWTQVSTTVTPTITPTTCSTSTCSTSGNCSSCPSCPTTPVYTPTNTLIVQSKVDDSLTSGAVISQTSGTSGMNGTTQYTRTAQGDISAVLRAPESHSGANFSYWSGCNSTSDQDCTVSVSGGQSKTVTANYTMPLNTTLNVQSRVDGVLQTGAYIEQIAGTGSTSGTTSYTRTVQGEISTVLKAPTTHLGADFSYWSGCDSVSQRECAIFVGAGQNKTVTVHYTKSSLVIIPSSLTVQSRIDGSLQSGAYISYVSGTSNMEGTTQYTRSRDGMISVTLRAPSTHDGSEFDYWTGCNSVSNRDCWVRVDEGQSQTIVANYTSSVANSTLYVQSRIDGTLQSGAVISRVSGTYNTDGTTGYSRTVQGDISTVLRAPSTHNGASFSYWSGCDSVSSRDCTVWVNEGQSKTITANYVQSVEPTVELGISKYVKNISIGENVWKLETNASPSDVLAFNIRVTNQSSSTLSEVQVRDILPVNMSLMSGTVMINDVLTSQSITSGIEIGYLSAGQTKDITFRAIVGASSLFSFGTTTLTNTAQTKSDGKIFSATALVKVIKRAVSGAADIPTGIGGTLTSYLILPFLSGLFGIFIFRKQWILFGRWLDNRHREAYAYRSEKALHRAINQVQQIN